MADTIKIHPLTRIEGHAELKLYLTGNGDVKNAEFKIYGPIRGFEVFLCGNPGEDVPRLATRICGICFTPHMIAAVKAIESAWEVEPPEDAVKLRKLMLLANNLQSHALHYVMLAAPDFLCSPYRKGGLADLIKQDKELVEAGIVLRQVGQRITQILGGRAIHPVTAIPGGMTKSLKEEEASEIRQLLKNAWAAFDVVKERTWTIIDKCRDMAESFEDIKSDFLYLEQKNNLNFYDADLRLMDKKGNVAAIGERDYESRLRKLTLDYSFVEQSYLDGMDPYNPVRVGPLARINKASWSNEMMKDFTKTFGRPAQNSFAFNIARPIEMEESIKGMQEILDEGIGSHIRDIVKPQVGTGVGFVEAPRGLLYHSYTTDWNGTVTRATIITPTQQNQLPIEKSAEAIAKKYITGENSNVREETLNKVEMVIRAYDPCVSCALRIVKLKE